MSFLLPELPDPLGATDWSLEVIATVELDAAEVGRIIARASETERGNAHSRICTQLRQGGLEFELDALLGVHAAKDKRGPYAHFSVRVALDERPQRKTSGADWGSLFAAFAQECPSVSAYVSARWQIPRELSSFVLELPIQLTSVPGFGEISGVRLVQREADEPRPLYAIALDETYGGRSVQVNTDAQLEVSESTVADAWKRALAIAELAVKPPMPARNDRKADASTG